MNPLNCPDCDANSDSLSRRQFVQTVGVAAAATSAVSLSPLAATAADKKPQHKPESLVKKLYESLNAKQKETIWFDWNHKDKRGLLRTHVSNNWQITQPKINSDFFNKDQQDMIEAIFFGLYHKDWHDRIRQQLKDDARGYGRAQSIALFGKPGSGKFEFVMTGRHLTIRCDGDSTKHAAFGGPIFYGHAAKGFNEKPDHPGNVFWPQAIKANKLYQMLDGKQQKRALIPRAPTGEQSAFPGIR